MAIETDNENIHTYIDKLIHTYIDKQILKTHMNVLIILGHNKSS